jgi:DNA repair photolyase
MNTALGQVARPPSGTQEWAAYNVNIQDGCEHDCLYCYAKAMAIRFKRATPTSWKQPKIRPRDLARTFTKRTGRIMFPTAHDITDRNLDACLEVLTRMLAAGNEVLIVSKPRLTCVYYLCNELNPFRDQILFRFSIGSTDNNVLSYWEPGASSYNERFASLQLAFALKYQTSVSGEPMLDGTPDVLVADVRPYVTDSVWLGKINRLRQILPINCPRNQDVVRSGDVLTESQSDKNIRSLYNRLRKDPLIKWKDSIKSVLNLRRPTSSGQDQ